jgi:tetratricopeptide (TPR) repeat protein
MKKIIFLLGIILCSFLMSSSFAGKPTNVSIVKGDEPKGIYGEDSALCVRNLSIYFEYYRQRNYAMAVEPWRWAYLNCPAARQNTYIHGAVLFKYLHGQENDPIRREAYVDSLMQLYDQRIKYFGREGEVLGRKAVDLYTYRPNNLVEIYEITERSIELEKLESAANVLQINFHCLVGLQEAGLKDETMVLEAFDRAVNIIDYNIKVNPDSKNQYEVVKNNLEVMFRPYASCSNITSIFAPRFAADPNNPELLNKIIDFLSNSSCTEEELYFKATLNLHRINPTAQSAFLMGRMEYNAGKYQSAIKFFEESISLQENEEDKFNSYMFMVEILFRQFNRYSDARSYALKALDARPNDGRPLLLIGEMYAASAKQCGDNEFTERVAYWAAVDKFQQAKRVDDDSAVQQRADLLIDNWSKHFPTNENIFFYGFEVDQVYTVQCWINERTRIRAR